MDEQTVQNMKMFGSEISEESVVGLKILFVVDSLKRGGMERRMIELLKVLAHRNNTAAKVVVLSNVIKYDEIYDTGIEIKKFKRKIKKDPGIFWKIYQYANEFRPDLVHCWGSMSTIYTIPSAKLLKIPIITSNVNDAPKWKHPFNSKLLRAKFCFLFADVVLGNSQAGLKSFGVPKSKGRCIVNGIELDRAKNLERPEIVKALYQVKTEKVVGMVGGFNSRKDHETFIKAAQIVLEDNDDVTFVALGGGPKLELSRQLIPEKFKDRIRLPGESKQVESFINIIDVGVLATNTDAHQEGISNAIMEYMLLGKPVVATDGGGTPELVEDQETGFLVPPYSPEILAKKIHFLLNNIGRSKEMGQKGRERIIRFFSLEKMGNNFFELYVSLQKKSRRS